MLATEEARSEAATGSGKKNTVLPMLPEVSRGHSRQGATSHWKEWRTHSMMKG